MNEKQLAADRKWKIANRELMAQRARDRYAADPEAARLKSKLWKEKHKDRIKAYKQRPHVKEASRIRSAALRESRKNDLTFQEKMRVGYRSAHLKRQYKMTIEQFSYMFEQQKGVCAICFKFPPKKENDKSNSSGKLHVDHCHKKNEVRALLCNRCNLALGKCDDSPVLLRAMADYIERYNVRVIL